ncbi:MAG: hypothetical protein Q9175_002850 [Cornicularia normoerica]
MQRPLDTDRLLALVDDHIDAGTFYIIFVKESFAEQNLSEGVVNLLLAFGMFRPYLHIHSRICEDLKRGPEKWRIDFGNRPFTHLSVRPDQDRSAFVKVYEDDRHLQTYEMLGHPEQWQAMMKWLWNYGNDRLIRQAAIEARRKASRQHINPPIPSDLSKPNSSRRDPAQKHPLDFALHRSLRPKHFKAQASKSKGKRKPSNLGMASLTLEDIEGEAGEDQTLQEKDPNVQTALAFRTEISAESDTGLNITSGDVRMAGAE